MNILSSIFISLAVMIGFLLAAYYDLFHWNVDWMGGIAYVFFGFALVPLTAFLLATITFLRAKEARKFKAFQTFLSSLFTMLICIGGIYIQKQIQIKKNDEKSYAINSAFFKSKGISEFQVVQDDPQTPLLKKPIIIANSASDYFKLAQNNSLTIDKPLLITVFIKNDFIPDNQRPTLKIVDIKQNSTERINLYEGTLAPANIPAPQEDYKSFTGEVLISNMVPISRPWLVIEGKNKIAAVMDLNVINNHAQKPDELPK